MNTPYRTLTKGRLVAKNGGEPVTYDSKDAFHAACRTINSAVEIEALLGVIGNDVEAFDIIAKRFRDRVRIAARLNRMAAELSQQILEEETAPEPAPKKKAAPKKAAPKKAAPKKEAAPKKRTRKSRRGTPLAIFTDEKGRLIHDFYVLDQVRECPSCAATGTHQELFGPRTHPSGTLEDGTPRLIRENQPWCRDCRRTAAREAARKRAARMRAQKAKQNGV